MQLRRGTLLRRFPACTEDSFKPFTGTIIETIWRSFLASTMDIRWTPFAAWHLQSVIHLKEAAPMDRTLHLYTGLEPHNHLICSLAIIPHLPALPMLQPSYLDAVELKSGFMDHNIGSIGGRSIGGRSLGLAAVCDHHPSSCATKPCRRGIGLSRYS